VVLESVHTRRSTSVVICAYTEERWNDVVEAVASIQRQTVTPDEIVLVCDHNRALLERARAAFPDVTVLANEGAQGLSDARNTGAAHSSTELLAFVDDDAVADPEWLEQLMVGYADPHVHAVGGSILPLWPQRRPAWFPEEFEWVVGCTYHGMPTAPAPVRNLIGCNMSVSRAAWAALGGFSRDFGHLGALPRGCEETEFFIRLHQRYPERTVLYRPQARVYHRVNPTRASWRYFASRCRHEGSTKALLARALGRQDALSNEHRYVLRTLPAGVLRGVAQAIFQFHPSGLARSTAIISGLTITSAAYLRTRWFSLARRRSPARAGETRQPHGAGAHPLPAVSAEVVREPTSVAAARSDDSREMV